MRTLLILAAIIGFSASAFAQTAAPATRGADLRCDTPGVAQLVVADTFAQNPSAKKLGLEVTSVTMLALTKAGTRRSVSSQSRRTTVFRSNTDSNLPQKESPV